MASIPPLAVPLPLHQSANAPRFDPTDHSTLQVYLSDYELAADAALLTPVERLSQSTRYLAAQEKEGWESLPKYRATPPDWDAFKAALFRDYPDAKQPSPSSAILDIFIDKKFCQAIQTPAEFSMFNREFRRITATLVAEGQMSKVKLQKAYTKSINPDLQKKIVIYLISEKALHVEGELYLIEQVRSAVEYILKGCDPCFDNVVTAYD